MCCQAILAEANFVRISNRFRLFFLGGGRLRFKPFWLKAKWRDPENDLSPDGQVQNGLNQKGCVSKWYERTRIYLFGYNNHPLWG